MTGIYTRVLLFTAALGLTACGATLPTREQAQLAQEKTQAALAAADQLRIALDLLGVLPNYTCEVPRRQFVGTVANTLSVDLGCATVSNEPGDDSDTVRATFHSNGCQVRGQSLTGVAMFHYSGGEDRLSLEADLTEVKVNGESLASRAGYGTCGDEKRYWASAKGAVPRREGLTFDLQAHVAKRDGVILIGNSSMTLDANGELKSEAGSDIVTCEALRYEVGEYLPQEGHLTIRTVGGTTIDVTFREGLWRLGQAEVSVNGGAPQSVPLVR